jgi:Ala-tRNA(Pro) deacylase
MLSRCIAYLTQNEIRYSHSVHKAVGVHGFSLPEGIRLQDLASTVVYCAGNRYGMLLLPASWLGQFWELVDFAEVRRLTGSRAIRLATASDLAALFPNCEVSALPPFGSLFQMPVLLAQDLTATESIKFSIGMPRDVIRISTADFKKLEEPIVTSFAATKCCRPTAAKAAA